LIIDIDMMSLCCKYAVFIIIRAIDPIGEGKTFNSELDKK